MVDGDHDAMDAEERTVLKLLKSFYKLVIARPDKSIFIEVCFSLLSLKLLKRKSISIC